MWEEKIDWWTEQRWQRRVKVLTFYRVNSDAITGIADIDLNFGQFCGNIGQSSNQSIDKFERFPLKAGSP